jgi:hypothetical protein
MIWLLKFLYLFVGFVFGFFISGLFAGSKIQRLESLLGMILQAKVKEQQKALKFVREIVSSEEQEADERIRRKNTTAH